MSPKWKMIDLFTGLAGFTKAALSVWGSRLQVLTMCEIDPRCRSFLSKTYPGVQIYGDIKTLDATQWIGTVDLVCGGPPCQPASCAGKQRGKEDDRWLWPEALKIVDQCKPSWCLFENPPGIGDVGLDGILDALESLGYEVAPPLDIPACAVDSPQIRARYWILAHTKKNDDRRSNARKIQGQVSESGGGVGEGCMAYGVRGRRRTDLQQGSGTGRRVADRWDNQGYMANTKVERVGTGLCNNRQAEKWGNVLTDTNSVWANSVWVPCADGKARRAPDDSFRLVDGLQRSLLGALGNSIAWPVAAQIMRAIKEADERKENECRNA